MKEKLFTVRILLAALGLDMFTVSLVISEVDKLNFEKIQFYSHLGFALLGIVCIWNIILYLIKVKKD